MAMTTRAVDEVLSMYEAHHVPRHTSRGIYWVRTGDDSAEVPQVRLRAGLDAALHAARLRLQQHGN